jgi:phenylalanyl-tRNA synthetase beta chain
MTISYKWLSTYLHEVVEPERLSKILTSIGLEVESLEKFETVKGGLEGVVVGEVMACIKHPDADKLSITTVNVGEAEPLQIICGAPNVAVGQKVLVALVGTTIYPSEGEPLTMSKRKIRGTESFGMICAEDELGLGKSHDGILVLPAETVVGTAAAKVLNTYDDWVFEIGLTPNHMDAMSHIGVARDVCAYLTHHNRQETRVKTPNANAFKVESNELPIKVTVENEHACQRYAGVSIKGIQVGASPQWMQDRLKAIGLRPINNIVDITNYILHESGQPLHAFDADKIEGAEVIVKNLPNDSVFVTLDGKERKLLATDLMICNGASKGMCIAGVYGGAESGVTENTVNVFLESAWFNGQDVRKTSLHHGLRTDAATRFEKGVDISNAVNVLKRAALMIKEIAGGEIASEVIDVYPSPKPKVEVALKNHYLKKLSGKNYHGEAINRIFVALGFEIVRDGQDELRVAVPYHKPDITIPADLVEEIMRIDGLDNVEIPKAILMSPQVEDDNTSFAYREKLSNFLTGAGFNEIFTNSITNSKYYSAEVMANSVKMLNNLSADLDVLRPSLLETGLESMSYNLNRKNTDLRFYEFGKSYSSSGVGEYVEQNHLCLFVSGDKQMANWKGKAAATDFYYLKGVVKALLQTLGLSATDEMNLATDQLTSGLQMTMGEIVLAKLGQVNASTLTKFDIKQAVYFADMQWDALIDLVRQNKMQFKEVTKFPAVQRDLALVVDKSLAFSAIDRAIKNVRNNKLQEVRLFDVFESDKLGEGKKSMAVNFTFLDEEKTLTDKEIDAMMSKLQGALEKEVGAVVRN